jgi:hypothetical protein
MGKPQQAKKGSEQRFWALLLTLGSLALAKVIKQLL